MQRTLDRLDFKGIFLGIIASLILSVLVGSASALFLVGLEKVLNWRSDQPFWIWFLPFGGVFIVYAYQRVEASVQEGNKALVRVLREPTVSRVSWKMAPWVLIATWLTHLGGGSAGREGTAVQISGSIAEQLSVRYPRYRIFFLQAGIAAGFSAVFGTPIAGMFFAFELSRTRQWIQLFWTALASFGANWVCTDFWQVSHTHYPSWTALGDTHWDFQTFGYCLILAFFVGLMAWIFKRIHAVMQKYVVLIQNPYQRILLGGTLLALLFQWNVTLPFQGLGVSTIEQAFREPMPWFFGGVKLMLTLFTLSIGFKGGEATPLFFVGAMTGNVVAQAIPLTRELAVALGFVSQFGAVVATPWTAVAMGLELFGLLPLHLLLVVAFVSRWIAGKKGLYEP